LGQPQRKCIKGSNEDNEAYSGKGGSSFWWMMDEVLVQDKTPHVTR